MNRVILIGTITTDITMDSLRQTKLGTPVTNFNVMTIESWLDKDKNINTLEKSHNIVCWGKLAETTVKQFKKGSSVIIGGSLSYRNQKIKDIKKTITEVKVSSISPWNQELEKASFNQVLLIGEVGSTPELRKTNNQTYVTNFSLNTYSIWKDVDNKIQTHKKWHRIVCWGKVAEEVVKKIKLNDNILLEGSISYRPNKSSNDINDITTEIKTSQVQIWNTINI
jgi:single-strand DNA-binding protein